MEGLNGLMEVVPVEVVISNNQGHSLDFWVELALKKLIGVADSAPNPIRAQANLFRDQVRAVIRHYMVAAVRSDRTTLYNALKAAGHNDVAEFIIKTEHIQGQGRG